MRFIRLLREAHELLTLLMSRPERMYGAVHSAAPQAGNFYKRVVSILPEERWPLWQLSRVYRDPGGTLTAILIAADGGATQRAISVESLGDPLEWRLFKADEA